MCTCCLPAFSFFSPLSCLVLSFLFLSFLPFFSFLSLFSSLLLSSSPYRLLVVLGCSFSSKYASLIRLRTHWPRSLPLTGRTHVADIVIQQHRSQFRDAWHDVPPVPRLRKVLVIVNLDAVRPLIRSKSMMMSWIQQHVMRCLLLAEYEELALFTYHVLIQHISSGNTHGVQPALLHQPTHLVHVGSLPASCFYGPPLARPDWGHLCPSQ